MGRKKDFFIRDFYPYVMDVIYMGRDFGGSSQDLLFFFYPYNIIIIVMGRLMEKY